MAKEGSEPEMKYCIIFEELDKPMVLNATNGQIIASITGSEDTDGWPGKKIVLYDDPNVSFGGKLVGGIRCRAPKNQPATAPSTTKASPAPAHGMLGKPACRPFQAVEQLPPASTEPTTDDDVPF